MQISQMPCIGCCANTKMLVLYCILASLLKLCIHPLLPRLLSLFPMNVLVHFSSAQCGFRNFQLVPFCSCHLTQLVVNLTCIWLTQQKGDEHDRNNVDALVMLKELSLPCLFATVNHQFLTCTKVNH